MDDSSKVAENPRFLSVFIRSWGFQVKNAHFVWFCGYNLWPHHIFVIPLSKWKWQQALQASTVGLKRPEAEVAQLFLWLFKDNLRWELWGQAVCVWYQIHAKTTTSDWLEFYLCKRSVWIFFITHALSFCYCGTQLCLKCMLKYWGLGRDVFCSW